MFNCFNSFKGWTSIFRKWSSPFGDKGTAFFAHLQVYR